MAVTNDPTAAGPCPICGSGTRQRVFGQMLLGKHPASYFLCDGCGLLQTETPHWLEEAYQAPIADTDTGILVRNLSNARLLNLLLQRFFDPDGRFVDVAGGYGLLTRLLRDRGFDCWRSDKYCQNLFAEGFEPAPPLAAEVLFAFEVLEHIADPVSFLTNEFSRYGCRSLVFSTVTFEGAPPAPGWWYYSTETGQHISFYQARTLATLAQRLGCHYFRIDDQRHVFSKEPMGRTLGAVLRRARVRALAETLLWERPKRASLTWADHEAAKRRLIAAQDATPPPSP